MTEERTARLGPWFLTAAAAVWGCWQWRPELTAVPYLDDSSMHEQMVRFATTLFDAGHLPLTSWFPYLGLGSPQFLHYQSLPAMLAGALGTIIGADNSFRWTLYLLLVLWPLCVYIAARLFGLGRWPSAVAALCSPLLASVPGVGYEPKAYLWIGYGVWAQLWASWTLPLAWAFTWRAMRSRRAVLPAAVLVALTMALHFETGYLALIPVVVFPLLCPSDLMSRLTRGAVVGAGAVLLSAWVTVPLIVEGRWAATNEILARTPLENGYGAKEVLWWLVTGRLYDNGRFPIVTLLVAAGVVTCIVRWRVDPKGRAVLAVWVMSLILSFGRTTFGELTVLLPASKDLFMRRFMMGAQLAGLYLAGIGALAVVGVAASGLQRWRARVVPGTTAGSVPALTSVFGVVAAVVVLWPAWTQMGTYAAANADAITAQQGGDIVEGSQLDQLIAYVQRHGGGRVYAGMPSNWGEYFGVGAVPVFKYLESKDVDEVGYTLRTASLMTDPEFYFDQSNPGDFALFGVHYMILPAGQPSPVPARLVMGVGPYRLWVLPGSGYVRLVDTVGVLHADRTDVGSRSVAYLRSRAPEAGRYLAVAYAGAAPAPLTVTHRSAVTGAAGTVVAERDDLAQGEVNATVVAHRRCAVVLSASFDPGWKATVDGHPVATEMLAPALVAVTVSPGRHHVVFRYGGFGLYPELWVLAVVALLGVLWIAMRARGAHSSDLGKP